MADTSLWHALWSPIVPAYGTMLAGLVFLWRATPAVMERLNERARDTANEKAADWTRLREEVGRLDTRCQHLEESEKRCQHSLSDAVRRIAELEGLNLGRGEARNEVQLLDSKAELGKPKDNGK